MTQIARPLPVAYFDFLGPLQDEVLLPEALSIFSFQRARAMVLHISSLLAYKHIDIPF